MVLCCRTYRSTFVVHAAEQVCGKKNNDGGTSPEGLIWLPDPPVVDSTVPWPGRMAADITSSLLGLVFIRKSVISHTDACQ